MRPELRILAAPAVLMLSFFASGCAHQIMRGSVVMKIDDQTAHVCLGKGEVEVGDRVAVYESRCGRGSGGVYTNAPYPWDCQLVRVGDGRVIETLNDHYSVVRLGPGVAAREGQIIEKE